jgi:cystathionine beta-lyase
MSLFRILRRMTDRGEDTKHVAPGRDPDPAAFRSLTTPIRRASTVVFDDLDSFEARASRLYDGYSYGLYGTPTSRALEERIAALEGGSRAIMLPSGLAAIALATLSVVRSGDRVLFPDSMYGPAKEFFGGLLERLGVEAIPYPPEIGEAIAERLDDRVRMVWMESPGSQTFEVQDVPAIARAAKARGIVSAADNTWASHLGFRPLDHGVDIAMQALSKHAGGHGDLVMGSLAVADETLFRRLKDSARVLGYGVSADDCALCERGLMTMPLRLRHSWATARSLVAYLSSRPDVLRILHPSVPDHPGHAIWRRDHRGAAGVFGLLLPPADREAQRAGLAEMRTIKIGASWGGVHSLIAPGDPRRNRAPIPWLPEGIYWRLSIGLEDEADLRRDLAAALDTIQTRRQTPSKIAG